MGVPALVRPHAPAADLYVLPTDRESFGLSALEALACGVPVLAYEVGGIVEVVRHGVTGSLRPVGDVDAMAADASGILQTSGRWEAMSRAAAADARQRFSANEIVAQYEALYASVL